MGERVTLLTLPNLDGLIGLARQDGVDVRPTLLRVLTDLYVQKRAHTPDEEHRYTELALWLLAGVDTPTRAAVAKKLATYEQAPRAVVRRLARDAFEVAEPVLKGSRVLTSEDLLAVISDFGPRYAGAIGARDFAEPPADQTERSEVARADNDSGHAAPDPASAEVRSSESGGDAATEAAPVPLADKTEAAGIGAYFLDAGSAERRLMLANLDDGTLSAAEKLVAAASDDVIRQLETAAMQRRPDAFEQVLEQSLRISAERARAIVHDDTGEPIVVAAKALQMPSDVLLRVLLFLNPVIGHSVERVFDLVDLYDRLSPEAALHLASSWQDTPARAGRPARYQPLHWDDEARGARQAWAQHARRFPLQVPDGRKVSMPADLPSRNQRTT
jgi:uncharacterized protein (DUF2336 family)